ncbi:hypothetical protein ACH5A3_29185 [Streptomyces echinatus]|uniref:hypothetical protein n=1 Tax=Streptomyces echinatus TaxID=67293 RepID=UPI0037AED3C6
MQEIAAEQADKLVTVKMNVDTNPLTTGEPLTSGLGGRVRPLAGALSLRWHVTRVRRHRARGGRSGTAAADRLAGEGRASTRRTRDFGRL